MGVNLHMLEIMNVMLTDCVHIENFPVVQVIVGGLSSTHPISSEGQVVQLHFRRITTDTMLLHRCICKSMVHIEAV